MNKKLISLFSLIELTRFQSQYGWGLRGLSANEQSNLAEHQYLVTFIAWQLASMVKKAGGKIDVLKVVEFAMVHDLGELFGGDIAMPYAKINPKAKVAAKKFEWENTLFLANFFIDRKKYLKLAGEIFDARSDEALIAKVADYIELTQFKVIKKIDTGCDDEDVYIKIKDKIDKFKDKIAKKKLTELIEVWKAEQNKKSILEIFEEVGDEN